MLTQQSVAPTNGLTPADGEDTPTSQLEHLIDRASELGPLLAGFFAVVVVVAGGSALALLVWPSHSGTYFSWDLGATPSAALVGGLYGASVVVFADALRQPRSESWSTRLGILGLALPTLVFTAMQHETFDWSRPQAVAWVVLFSSAPVSILIDLRAPTRPSRSPKVSVRIRMLLGTVSLGAAGLAAGLWAHSSRDWLGTRSPVPLAGLTSNYLGAWCTFVAVAAVVACIRGRVSDARSIGVLLGSISAGAGLAAVRTASDLQASPSVYLGGLAALAVIAGVLVSPRQSKPHDTHDSRDAHVHH